MCVHNLYILFTLVVYSIHVVRTVLLFTGFITIIMFLTAITVLVIVIGVIVFTIVINTYTDQEASFSSLKQAALRFFPHNSAFVDHCQPVAHCSCLYELVVPTDCPGL